MVAELRMQLDAMVITAQFLGKQADELQAELDSITKEWAEVSTTWTGVAASAFDPPFDEWHYGAITVVSILAEESRLLSSAAAAMAANEGNSAQALSSVAVDDSRL